MEGVGRGCAELDWAATEEAFMRGGDDLIDLAGRLSEVPAFDLEELGFVR